MFLEERNMLRVEFLWCFYIKMNVDTNLSKGLKTSFLS